jgi:hypothetical protein
MSKLETPYQIGKQYDSQDNVRLTSVNDANGVWVFDCFEIDADEIVKRINENEQLKARVAELEEELGLTRISLDARTGLLNSCERALAERDLKIEQIQAQNKQSLADIKAEAIEEFVKAYEMQKVSAINGGEVKGVASFYSEYADQLQAEGE